MHVCAQVCACVSVHVCKHLCLHACVCMCLHPCVCACLNALCMRMSVGISVCVYMYACVYLHLCIHVCCVCWCLHVCVCMCVYTCECRCEYAYVCVLLSITRCRNAVLNAGEWRPHSWKSQLWAAPRGSGRAYGSDGPASGKCQGGSFLRQCTVTFCLRNHLHGEEVWDGDGGVCLWKGNPLDQERRPWQGMRWDRWEDAREEGRPHPIAAGWRRKRQRNHAFVCTSCATNQAAVSKMTSFGLHRAENLGGHANDQPVKILNLE